MQRRLYREFIKIETPEASASGVFNLGYYLAKPIAEWMRACDSPTLPCRLSCFSTFPAIALH